MKNFNNTIATLSIAAAGVFVAAGMAKADSSHHHAYAHLPHSHHPAAQHQHQQGQAIGNAIVIGGLLLGGIALFDALQDQNKTKAKAAAAAGTPYAYDPQPHLKPPVVTKPLVLHPTLKPRPLFIEPTLLAPKPLSPRPLSPKPVTYSTHCRDHGHIGLAVDGRREFSLRRPSGSKLMTIHAGRPVLHKVAKALHVFDLDTTCVIKTSARGVKAQTRFLLSNGRFAKVPAHWSGADKIIRFTPETLVIDKVQAGKFRVEKPNGQLIETLPTRAQARAVIAYLGEMKADKKVIIKNLKGEKKFAFFAR